MLTKRNHLEHVWSPGGIGPGLAARPQANFDLRSCGKQIGEGTQRALPAA